MNSSAILWAVPFYLFMIFLELIISYFKNKKLYSFSESMSNISCGIVQQVSDAVTNLLFLPLYMYIHSSYSIFSLDTSFLTLLLLFIYKDFVYYWTHRLTHTSFLWAIHLVHHQPKKFNYSVGLRMPLFHYVIDIIPMMIAAILGFSVESYILVSVFFASIQIFSHTTFIKKEIPIFSWLFVTPSFHRVHHAKNSEYLNKNFSAVICLWDKLFNTYQKEIEGNPIEFGVVDSNQYTLNPIEANLVYWKKEHKPLVDKRIFSIRMLIILFPAIVFIAFAKELPLIISSILAIILIVIYQMASIRAKVMV